MKFIYNVSIGVIGLIGIGIVGCVFVAYFYLSVLGSESRKYEVPEILTAVNGTRIETSADWERNREALIQQFETEVYGAIPDTDFEWQISRTVLDENAYSGKGVVELLTMQGPPGVNAVNVVVIYPKYASTSPLLITASFCPNHQRWPEYDLPVPKNFPSMCGPSPLHKVVLMIFGEYIEDFPIEYFLDNGIAFAGVYLGESVPDDAFNAPLAMQELSQYTKEPVDSTIAAWAWLYGQINNELEKDIRIQAEHTSVYGLSRDGKASLLAGALYPNIDATISHHSGTGGARLNRSDMGEPIASMCKEYPHWFPMSYCTYADREEDMPLDQHQLIALAAPRPLFLSGARHDKWADPQSSLFAMQKASAVYQLYAVPLSVYDSLHYYSPTSTLAFFFRESFHGARMSDWEAIVAFLRAHF